MSKLSIVVGGQYGSEAKGATAAYLARPDNNETYSKVVGIRVAGPNAGHTAYGTLGEKWALRQVPVIAVTNPQALLVLGPGSEIDLQVLNDEVTKLNKSGLNVSGRLIIDDTATVINPEHLKTEQQYELNARCGSTGKGVGAARANRAMRYAEIIRDIPPTDLPAGVTVCDTVQELQTGYLRRADAHVIIEGTQGYGLGLHTWHYPQTTSSDCRAIDFLAMAGISPWQAGIDRIDPWVVLRTYPIRVAGNSGHLHRETTWEKLGLPDEYTTVTQKVRRVGHWDPALARDAVQANGGPEKVQVWLSMVDQVVPAIAGYAGRLPGLPDETHNAVWKLLHQVEKDCGVLPSYVGTGPNSVVRVV